MSKNLIVIMSDEHQSGLLSCAGHPFIKTPHLDRLAATGVRYTNAYTPSPICVPARAAFASGRHVHRTGHWDNAIAYAGDPKGWGHQLQDAGVPVTSIGKLHYRREDDDAGFDESHIPMMIKDGVGMIWASIRLENERLDMPARMLGPDIGVGESSYTTYDRAVTARSVDWIKEKSPADQGWCLYIGLVAPHFPLVCPEEFYNLYKDIDLPSAKLHPDEGYPRHPWAELQNSMGDSEGKFKDADERDRAFRAYYGLVSWMDHNVGQIMDAVAEAGLADDTTIIYTSDHGDNVGARGLWGKSNMYEESAAIPMIVSSPQTRAEICETPVSLLDLAASIPDFFNLPQDPEYDGTPLKDIAAQPYDAERVVFSEYHAAGAVTGAFMIRKGAFKLIHYVGFEPELFDLDNDPEELANLADHPEYATIKDDLYRELYVICDPDEVEARAHREQRELVESYGGLEAVKDMGPKGATPPPEVSA